MRTLIFAAAIAAALAGCTPTTNEYAPKDDEPVLVDDCPDGVSKNGEPCK